MARKAILSPRSAGRILLPGRNPTDLVLTFAGNIVKHLGVQMYAGRPVPAIAELISNAWDADATNVQVRLPLNIPWDQTNPKHVIEVEDKPRSSRVFLKPINLNRKILTSFVISLAMPCRHPMQK
jgi:hypothetical protein